MVHDDLYTKMLQSWNVTNTVINFFNERIQSSKKTNINFDKVSDEDWKYFNHMKLLYRDVTTQSNKGLFDSNESSNLLATSSFEIK